MKQITLDAHLVPDGSGLCLGKLIFTWALYGYAMAMLWRLAGPSWLGQAAVWTLALLVGRGLARVTQEI